jgi:hypothetical protein
VNITVTRATTASGAIYEFLPDLSRVRRLNPSPPSAAADGGFGFMEMRCDDEWVRIVTLHGVKSPDSFDVIRVGLPLILTLEPLSAGEGTTRHTTPVVSITTHELSETEM